MGKMRLTVSALAVSLAASSLIGCRPDWMNEDKTSDADVEDPDTDGGISPPTRGFPVDGGFANTPFPPMRLNQLLVADTPPPAISGGSLAISKAGDLAVAADPDRDLVYLVSLPEGTVRTVSLSKGSEPGRVALDDSGHAHVGLRNKGTVVRIDLATATVAAETPVCQLPRGLLYDAAHDEVVVACASGELVALSAGTHAEHSRAFIALDLRDVLLHKSGDRLVSRYRSAELLHVGADGKVKSQVGPLSAKGFRVDSSPFGISKPVDDLGSHDDVGPVAPGFGSGSARQVTSSATLAWRTVSAPDGTAIMLHQESQDDEVIISQAGGYGAGCQPITQPGITRYDSAGKPTPPIMLGGAALVVDLAVSKDGKWLAVAKPGAYLRGEQPSLEVISAKLQVVESSPLDGRAGPSPVPPPLAPSGLIDAGVGISAPIGAPVGRGPALDAGGGFIATASDCTSGWGTGSELQTTAVAFDEHGNLYAFSREPAQLLGYSTSKFNLADETSGFANLEETLRVQLSTASVRDTGHELFHADVGTGLACASCHGELLDDGHVWNFKDFGPRRTQNMRGGLLGTLPLHWEGDLATFQNLVDEVMTRRMGGFKVEAQYADALSKWIDKQPAIKLEGSDASASTRGKALFESPEVLCSTCHSGAALTNNLTVDVGTGGSFQVPSLRGLALHAPFMHDGCAAVLSDRFDAACGGGDKHGKTSQLSDAQRSDLVAYLETL